MGCVRRSRGGYNTLKLKVKNEKPQECKTKNEKRKTNESRGDTIILPFALCILNFNYYVCY